LERLLINLQTSSRFLAFSSVSHQLFPTFLHSQQDAQEFLINFVNQLDEEMSVRLQYFVYSAKKNFGSRISSNEVPALEGNKENKHDNVKQSPFSIAEVPKTDEKNNLDNGQPSTSDDDIIHISSSASSANSISSLLFKTPNMKKGRNASSSSAAATISEKWNEERYVSSLTHAVVPSTIYFNNCLEISMKCLSCNTELPPKYEYFRDFSLDMDIPSALPPSASSSSASPVSSSSSAATTSPSTSTLLSSPLLQSKQREGEQKHEEISLDLLLDNFFKDDVCPWNCSSCAAKDGFVRIRKRIIYLSKYIIIHLKRFHYSMETSLSTKIDHKIKMNLFYNFKKYFKYPSSSSTSATPASSTSFRSPMLGEASKKAESSELFYKRYNELWNSINPLDFMEEISHNNEKEKSSLDFLSQLSTIYDQIDVVNKEKDFKNCPLVAPAKDYEVTGVIRHLGSDLTSGHYICDIKNPYKKATKYQQDDQDLEIKWIRYNDTVADPVSEVSSALFLFHLFLLFVHFMFS
jgi:hypothetical protein